MTLGQRTHVYEYVWTHVVSSLLLHDTLVEHWLVSNHPNLMTELDSIPLEREGHILYPHLRVEALKWHYWCFFPKEERNCWNSLTSFLRHGGLSETQYAWRLRSKYPGICFKRSSRKHTPITTSGSMLNTKAVVNNFEISWLWRVTDMLWSSVV